jgi:DNA-binding NarL/FixJ family response regulator
MTQPRKAGPRPLGLIWVRCPNSVGTAGILRALAQQARVHTGSTAPEGVPSSIILCASGQEDLSQAVEREQELNSDAAPPILIFGSHLDLALARDALRAGASGFIHAGMTPDQLIRAVRVAIKGELVAPRELLRYLMTQEEPAQLDALSARQREILDLVVEGLSNAEIASRLFLSESTIKQHLRAAYKLLGVNNRTEAAKLIRRDG